MAKMAGQGIPWAIKLVSGLLCCSRACERYIFFFSLLAQCMLSSFRQTWQKNRYLCWNCQCWLILSDSLKLSAKLCRMRDSDDTVWFNPLHGAYGYTRILFNKLIEFIRSYAPTWKCSATKIFFFFFFYDWEILTIVSIQFECDME